MGFRFAILIFFFHLSIGIGSAQEVTCLKCHQPHYETAGECVDCHRGNPRTERLEIAHYRLIAGRYAHFTIAGSPVVEKGRQLIKDFHCQRCHVSGDKGNRLAANLDRATVTSLPEEIFDAVKKPVVFMPDFHFSDAYMVKLVNGILANAAKAKTEIGEVPLVIHFEKDKTAEENVFVKHCGFCHRVLTSRFGGLGNSDIGPNLSGLLTEYYPPTYQEKERWTVDALEKWLKNPREIRELTQMPPQKLSVKEFKRLLKEVWDFAENI